MTRWQYVMSRYLSVIRRQVFLCILAPGKECLMIIIDKLCYASRLRYMNASVKTLLAVLTLIFCITDRSVIISLLILAVMSWLTIKKGGVPLSRYLKLMRIPLVFLFLSTLAILVNISASPMDAFAIPLGSIYITSSYAALLHAAQLILTALASVSCLYFLSLSTPVTDLLGVMKRFHLPDLFIELMLLIYRFIFVLFGIADALSTSRDSRLGNVDFRTSCRSFGSMASALFIRAFKKSNALYDAMESRCYNGRIHVLSEEYPPERKHLCLILLFELMLIVISVTLRISGLHY